MNGILDAMSGVLVINIISREIEETEFETTKGDNFPSDEVIIAAVETNIPFYLNEQVIPLENPPYVIKHFALVYKNPLDITIEGYRGSITIDLPTPQG